MLPVTESQREDKSSNASQRRLGEQGTSLQWSGWPGWEQAGAQNPV